MEKVTRVINMCEADVIVCNSDGDAMVSIPSQDACLYLKYVRRAGTSLLHLPGAGAVPVSPAVSCGGVDRTCPGYALFCTLVETDAIIVSPRAARWLSSHRNEAGFRGVILAQSVGSASVLEQY